MTSNHIFQGLHRRGVGAKVLVLESGVPRSFVRSDAPQAVSRSIGPVVDVSHPECTRPKSVDMVEPFLCLPSAGPRTNALSHPNRSDSFASSNTADRPVHVCPSLNLAGASAPASFLLIRWCL